MPEITYYNFNLACHSTQLKAGWGKEIFMFEVYGEFDSAAEINEAAANQLKEGDTEAVRQIAKENGLDPEDAEDFILGTTEELCTPLMAAFGKIKVESAEIKTAEIVNDWINYVKSRCLEDPAMAMAVRHKGKSLKDCIATLLKWSFKHMYEIDNKLCEAAGVSTKQCAVKLGIPGMETAYRLIADYYMGGGKR